MIRTAIIAALAVATFNAATAQQVASLDTHPTLRASANVTGDLVRIGDLIENAGIVANVAIFRAPELGTTGSVSASQVVDAVRAHSIVGLDTNGVTAVTVTRASRTIATSEIEGLIAASLASQFPMGAAEDIAVTFDQAMRGVHVDAGLTSAPHLAGLSYNQRNGRFDAILDVPGAPRRRITGTAIPTTSILTLSRPIARGEVIKTSELVMERRPRSEVTADVLTDVDQINGLAARSALGSNRPLRSGDLMKPELVRRNDNVTLVYEVPGITLTLRGKASDGGAEGDAIEVLNVQSKRVVQGVIIGPGRVLVTNATPSVVAEAEPKSSVSSKAPVRAQ